MNFMDIFNNLSTYKLSKSFNNDLIEKINRKRKLYMLYYPFIFGFLLIFSIIVAIISVFQIYYQTSVAILVLAFSVIVFMIVLFQIKDIWRKVNLL
jgi:ABC-type transport system involved in cytochrome bd biosynthesis fused ATPase/permease subunit